MFLVFWISDFLYKFGILCKAGSVEIFHRKIGNQEQNFNIHKIFKNYRIFKSLVFHWVVRGTFETFCEADRSVGTLIHWSVGPYVRLFVSPILILRKLNMYLQHKNIQCEFSDSSLSFFRREWEQRREKDIRGQKDDVERGLRERESEQSIIFW